MEEEEELLLWQRASFLEGPAPRSVADSLRLRLSLLNHSYQCSANGSQLLQFIRSYMHQYSHIIDCQDKMTGLNNFAEPIQTLVGQVPNESKEWRSGLIYENVVNIPQIQQLLTENKFNDISLAISKDDPILPPIPIASHSSCPQVKPHPLSPPPVPVLQSSTTQYPLKNSQFQYKPPQQRSISDSSDPSVAGPSRYDKGSGQSYVPRQKRRRQQDSDESEDEGEMNKGRGQRSAFVTAKDQYIINQKKKFGGWGGTGERKGGVSHEPNTIDNEINVDAYGNTKKSLGTRRTPGSQFVPPIKKTANNSDEISSRVLYNNNKGGSNTNSCLPPELEGDERLKNIEPRMVELIMNEIMDHSAPVAWDDIAGLEFAKTTIKEIVVWPMMRPDIFKGLRGPPKGILLFGPPGTGKTLIGKCVASQVKATFFSISASSLTSKWVGEGEKMVRALFAVARCYQPAVVFIDEIDSLLSQRSDSEHESSRRIKTEFLVQLDGATTSAEDRLLVIGATNRPQEIDEAARRRLVKRLYIPLPDNVARRQIVMNLLKEQPFSLSEDDLDKLCHQTEGYSGADMANLCREAALGPIRDAAPNIQYISAEEVRPVNYEDFVEAFHNIRPSVSEKDLALFIDWNERYGCGSRR